MGCLPIFCYIKRDFGSYNAEHKLYKKYCDEYAIDTSDNDNIIIVTNGLFQDTNDALARIVGYFLIDSGVNFIRRNFEKMIDSSVIFEPALRYHTAFYVRISDLSLFVGHLSILPTYLNVFGEGWTVDFVERLIIFRYGKVDGLVMHLPQKEVCNTIYQNINFPLYIDEEVGNFYLILYNAVIKMLDDIEVELFFDDNMNSILMERVGIPREQALSIPFKAEFDRPGLHKITIRIKHNGNSYDLVRKLIYYPTYFKHYIHFFVL